MINACAINVYNRGTHEGDGLGSLPGLVNLLILSCRLAPSEGLFVRGRFCAEVVPGFLAKGRGSLVECDVSTQIDFPAWGFSISTDSVISCGNATERFVGTKKSGKGRRKIGRKKRRMRAKIRHRKK